jgi:glucosyl-3-phosphoglycerate synthase
MTSRVRAWHRHNTFHHERFPVARLLAERERDTVPPPTVSVCLPARDEERTIGAILESLHPLREVGLVDQIAVVDASADRTPEIARALGAEVYSQEDLIPEQGAVLGKGDAMWRALSVLRGDLVCFLDADSEGFGPHYACGLLGPLICDRTVAFVKACYRRPFRVGSLTLPDEGGRVTELTARPLLNLFYPELAGFEQPLAGEFAARRTLLERLPFMTGYGVEIGLLIDAYAVEGLDGLAQVDLDLRQNAHQPLRELGPMAAAVLRAVALRLGREGRLTGALPDTFTAPGAGGLSELMVAAVERPPLASAPAAA